MLKHNHAIQQVAFREDAHQLAFLVEHAHGADSPAGHKLRCFHHGRRSFHRIRLSITNDISDQHRRASWGSIKLFGCKHYMRVARGKEEGRLTWERTGPTYSKKGEHDKKTYSPCSRLLRVGVAQRVN